MEEQPTPASAFSKRVRLVIVGASLAGALIIAGIIVILAAPTTKSPAPPINSFKECADAGYPIQESFPERCAVPGGKTFTNN